MDTGAKTQLLVKLGSNWVKFGGELYLKQAGALTLLGLKFSMNGLYAKAFDVNRLNLYDLVLEGEAGVASGALLSITIYHLYVMVTSCRCCTCPQQAYNWRSALSVAAACNRCSCRWSMPG